MLFNKIIIEKSSGTDPKIPYWYMIFRLYDVIEYMKLYSVFFTKALINLQENLQKIHQSRPREVVLNATLETKSLSGERVSPLNYNECYSEHEKFMKYVWW